MTTDRNTTDNDSQTRTTATAIEQVVDHIHNITDRVLAEDEVDPEDEFETLLNGFLYTSHARDVEVESVTVAIDTTRVTSDPEIGSPLTSTAEDITNRWGIQHSTNVATITAVSTPKPILLGIEPIQLPGDPASDRTPPLKIVQSLVDKAEQYVEIKTVIADREFDSSDAIAELEQRDLSYIIPKRKHSHEQEVISELQEEEHDVSCSIEPCRVVSADGKEETTNVAYVPREDNSTYTEFIPFLTNRESPAVAFQTIPEEYQERLVAETQNRLLTQRLRGKSVGATTLGWQDCVAAATEVNAYSLANYLLDEKSGQSEGRHAVGLDVFLQFFARHSSESPRSESGEGTSAHGQENLQTERDEHADVVESLAEQACTLCDEYEDLATVVTHLDIQENWFTDQCDSRNAVYDFESIVRLLLYRHACSRSYGQVLRDLENNTAELDLQQLPTEQTLSYAWRNRISRDERLLIQRAAERIRAIHAEQQDST